VKLKSKLKIAFIIMIIVPLFLIFIAIMGLSQYQLKAIENYYEIENNGMDSLSNPVQILSKLTKKMYGEVKIKAEESPDSFLDKTYLDQLSRELEKKYSYIVVRQDNEIIYSSNEQKTDLIEDSLPLFGEYDPNLDGGIYIGGDIQELVKQYDFYFSDHSEGSIFIITNMSILIPQVKRMLFDMLASMILIMVMTSGLLIIWIYGGIVRPIRKLKDATTSIKDGNLDFTVEAESKDEVGELCVDFEEMRKRLKESVEERIQDDKDNRELISNISHDLKTPITAIKGYVEGIMDGVADTPEKLDRYVKTIYNKVNDMDRLIDELFFYSKIDTNRIPYMFNRINLDSYFKDCIEEVGLELEAQNIELGYFNYADESIEVIADAEQMKRVINNIISNSVKYMEKGRKGIINIRIKDVGDFVQVEIEDNGKGIAKKDLPYIFDRFYRTDSSRNSSKGGSGIGLSIVRKIIEDHGGKIWATSKESTGTVMYFVLRKYQEGASYE
jgi:signal transduction histidine kinase